MRSEEEIRQRLISKESWMRKFKHDLEELDPDEPLYYLTQNCLDKCHCVISQMKWVLMEEEDV